MKLNEIYNSDVVYMGRQVIKISEFKSGFPEWYEDWDKYMKENEDEFILITDYEYGVSATLNAFYKVDFDKARADLVAELEGGKYGGIYHPPARLGERMIFAPRRADKWAYFDLRKKQLSYADIPKRYFAEGGQIFIQSWKSLNDSIIYLPGDAGVFAKLDFRSGKISYYENLTKIITDGKPADCLSAMSVYGEFLLISLFNCDELFEIDVREMKIINTYKIGHGIRGIKTMFVPPRTDWLFFIENTNDRNSGGERAVYKWNIVTDELLRMDKLPIAPCNDEATDLLAGFLYYRGAVYVTPGQGDCFIKTDIESSSAERVEVHTGHNYLERKNPYYQRWADGIAFPAFTYNGFSNSFTVTLPYDYSIAELDFERKQIVNCRKWNVNGVEKLIKENLAGKSDEGYYENNFYSLKDFLEDLL